MTTFMVNKYSRKIAFYLSLKSTSLIYKKVNIGFLRPWHKT